MKNHGMNLSQTHGALSTRGSLSKIAFAGLVLLLGINLMVGAQDILTADRYLADVAERYASIKDYQAKILISTSKATMKGSLIHKSPSLLRIDFSQPMDQVISYNGEELTVYIPEYRAVLSQNVGTGSSGVAGASLASAKGLSILRRNYSVAYDSEPGELPLEEGSSELVIKLSLTRKSVAEGFRSLTLSISPSTKLMRRIEGKTIADENVRFDFTDIILDQGIPEARFVYDSPASANRYNNFLFKETD
jgi:outer membrane lipoprotein-sorting protein